MVMPAKKDTVVIRDTVTMSPNQLPVPYVKKKVAHKNTAVRRERANNGDYSPASNQTGNDVSQQATPQKKGLSAAAKDAAIGGAAGIATGAIIDKNNRIVGGLIGGIIGSGAGYLIGRARDRKTGRIVKHKSNNANYNYANQQ